MKDEKIFQLFFEENFFQKVLIVFEMIKIKNKNYYL